MIDMDGPPAVNGFGMPRQRQDSFREIESDGAFDVLVVGGGINGIGVYRDLSLQGLRVLLVERNDFCSGCSAAPSRMIHGGLRYLENGELDLVRESLRERDALLRNAPHMVRPLPTTIPITGLFSGLFNAAVTFLGWSGKPSNRGALPIKLGLSLYDMITDGPRQLPRHSFRGGRATRAHWPHLTPKLRWSATYYDAWISHPERLGMELILDTERMAPASIALHYANLRRGGAGGFEIADSESGTVHRVTARAVVNAAGAWLDEVIAGLTPQGNAHQRLVSGTKGSHLILDNEAVFQALDGHMIYFENTDGRVCIVFPYLGKVLVGSTDIRVASPVRPRCEPEETDYILASLRLIFPELKVEPSDIVFSYSGIRPLPVSDHDFTGRISRGHFTRRIDGEIPLFCMVGGKWTTFRAFAEQTADGVLKELGLPRRCRTGDLPIGGGKDFPSNPDELIHRLAVRYGVPEMRARHLADAYGTRAEDLLVFCAGRADDHPLHPNSPITGGEIAWLIRQEHVLHLADIVLRRTLLAITGQVNAALIDRIAMVAARELGWSPERAHRERGQLIAELRDYHNVTPEMLEQRAEEGKKSCA
jgi:glycerol-3-phosphate dehydrogenase